MSKTVVTVKVSGLDDLERVLYELPTKLAKKAMRSALRAAGGVWLREMIRNAPRAPGLSGEATGWLEKNLTMTTQVSARYDQGEVRVGPRMKQNPARHDLHVPTAANEAYWYEMGTSQQPPRPIFRQAYESKKNEVLARFADVLRQALETITRP
jgi:HK97 gp10 family phage protein